MAESILGSVGGAGSSIGNGIVSSLESMMGNLAQDAVKTVLSSMWPRDFELYMVSLELTNYRDEILDYMTFPVNPESISKTEPQLKNITRAYNSIVVNSSGMFVPQDISIKGNFGKKFKVLLRTSGFSGSFSSLVSKSGRSNNVEESNRKEELSPFFKSGYGCLKVLQEICSRSSMKDDDKSRRLYFHNFMLGESYLVEVLSMQEDMSMSTNMMWGYDLKLKVISPINLSKGKRLALTATGLLQNTVTDVVNGCLDSLGSVNWW